MTIAYPLAVGVYAVTRYEFARFVARTGYSDANRGLDDKDQLIGWSPRQETLLKRVSRTNWRRPGFSQTGSHPVTHVNWRDAQAYVTWLSRRTGEEYRLLSEAEWEYVARAGAPGPIRFGPPHPLRGYFVDGPTVPAESMPPNAFGVRAVGGKFFSEWTQDCWHGTYECAPDDGSAWTSDVADVDTCDRVVRACDKRSRHDPGSRWGGHVFRVAHVLR